MQDIITAINTVGFPIIAAVGVAWYAYTMQCKSNETIDRLRETLEENTLVMTKICERLGQHEEVNK